VDRAKKSAIAEEVGLSPTHVANLLKEARDQNIVHIRIERPPNITDSVAMKSESVTGSMR